HPRRASGKKASCRAEPGRSRTLPGRRRQPEAPHHSDHLLRDRSTDFRSRPSQRLTENEFIDFSRLWHDGCVKAIIEAQDVDRNHSAKYEREGQRYASDVTDAEW